MFVLAVLELNTRYPWKISLDH